VLQYEEHKFRAHYHQCSVCGKSYPSDRLLSIHISELHDNYFAALSKRKPSYCCLVLGCNAMFWNNADRRSHLVKEHEYHPSYDFHNPKRYLQKSRKKVPSAAFPKGPVDCCTMDTDVAGTAMPVISGETGNKSTSTGGNRAQRRAEKRTQHASAGSENLRPYDATPYAPAGSSSLPRTVTDTDTASDAALCAGRKNVHSSPSAPGSLAEAMAVSDTDGVIEALTAGLRNMNVKVPSKISFGHKKRHGHS
jgi:hypothetical protein